MRNLFASISAEPVAVPAASDGDDRRSPKRARAASRSLIVSGDKKHSLQRCLFPKFAIEVVAK
jgi:hypothetical protein